MRPTDDEGEDAVAEQTAQQPSRAARRASVGWRLLPIGALAGLLVVMVALYLGYDLVTARLTPCEAIFRQTALSLSTKMKFLKTEGQVQVGRAPLVELDARAQMTALNLKTCCAVLDAGKLDPEQFLQCKSKARDYEARIEDVVAIVQAALRKQPTAAAAAPAPSPASSPANIETGSTSAPAPAADAPASRIKASVEAARAASKAFNREIVEVRKTQALETLKALPPRHVEVSAQEREPNDDVLSTNIIDLGKWITAAIGGPKDADFFALETPARHRDWIRIELDNRSTTLEPRIELFDKDKASLGEMHKTTKGANLAHTFVGAPGTRYLFRVSNYYGESVGAYLVRAVATKAYDAHEPNDDILSASSIAAGTAVTAAIMDKGDVDFFRLAPGTAEQDVQVDIKNASTTLHPNVEVFDANKTRIGQRHNTTAGGDLSYAFKARANVGYYVRVSDYYSEAAGAYSLTVGAKN
jgi:hypothetical protein